MKLSTRGRYAARVMLELALHYGEGPVLLKEIAKTEKISNKYLEHLVKDLKREGLVFSFRGAKGGYMLSREPKDINLAEVVEATEGSLMPTECLKDPASCKKSAKCVTREVWCEIGKGMIKTLKSINLSQMAARHIKRRDE